MDTATERNWLNISSGSKIPWFAESKIFEVTSFSDDNSPLVSKTTGVLVAWPWEIKSLSAIQPDKKSGVLVPSFEPR